MRPVYIILSNITVKLSKLVKPFALCVHAALESLGFIRVLIGAWDHQRFTM